MNGKTKRTVFYPLLALGFFLQLASAANVASAPVAPKAAPASLPAVSAASEQASKDFAALAQDYWDTQMRLSPLDATFLNYPRYHERLDDNGPSGRAEEERELNRLLKSLLEIDPGKLRENDRISWEILKFKLEDRLAGIKHKFYQWNVDHMEGPQTQIGTVVEIAQPMKTAEDAQALITRMKAMPLYFQRHIANLREGMQEGRTAPRVVVEKTMQQLEALIKSPPEKTPFAAAAERLPEDARRSMLPAVVTEVKASVYPAYAAYLLFLRREYLKRAQPDEKPGLVFLPGGTEAYRYMVRHHTTVDKDPQEIHQIGLKELEGIQAEMAAIAKKMGHSGDVASFIDKVRHDPANFFTTRESVEQAAKDFVAAAYVKLPRYFGVLPRTPLVVRPTEEYREKNGVAAEYFPLPDDLSRPGIYYINTYEPTTRPRFEMASTAAHEGVPGHHLQIAIAVENRALPAFRRNGDFNAYIEGWALYSERLADEMGLYTDDLSRLGMLSNQAWRASRLVVDTGLHAMGWSRQKAIDFMKSQMPTSEEEIATEVDRYIVWPGQALSYKIGQREIMDIRAEAERTQGQRFDIRSFHDAVLKNGAVPLPMLRRLVLAPD